MTVTGAIFSTKYANAITRHEQKKKMLSHATPVSNKREQTEDKKLFSYPILYPLCHLHQRNQIKMKFTQLRIYFNVVCQVHVFRKKASKKREHFIAQFHNTEVK